jgi:hypothetical protein
VKKKIKTSMQMAIIVVCLCGGAYAWWPRGKEGFTCVTRPYDGVLKARGILLTVCMVMAHASFWYSIWVFRKKKTKKNNQPRGNHGERQRWYSV